MQKFSISGHELLEVANLVSENRVVELICFALMPNHYHIILKEIKEGGISRYMHRLLTAYSMYFNTCHEKIDHLFGGPFRAVHIESNEQFLHTTAYIHRNPIELGVPYETYTWSSFQDYSKDNRWGNLLKTQDLKEQFDLPSDYDNFVRTSPAKDKLFNLDLL